MKKSFDQNIKDRLSSLEWTPKAGLKSAVLGQIVSSPPWYIDLYKYLGALFLLLSIFNIGVMSTPAEKIVVVSEPRPIATSHFFHENVFSQPLNLLINKHIKPKQVSQSTSSKKKNELAPSQLEVINKENFGFVNMDDYQNSNTYSMHEVDQMEMDLALFSQGSREVIYLEEDKEVRPIIVEKDKAFFPYYNIGSYFLYNRLKPNLNDNIYIGEYDSPFGLSANRLGLLVEYGVERKITSKLSLRAGLSLNNYKQQYSFSVRNTKPSLVERSIVNDGFFEPSFVIEHVEIAKRVTLAGLKTQVFWHIFPEKTNVFFLSGEYQLLLGDGPTLQYNEKSFSLMKKNQFLVELGMKKLLVDFKNNGLYIMPSLRYGIYKLEQESVLNVKPFSVGLTLSLGIK